MAKTYGEGCVFLKTVHYPINDVHPSISITNQGFFSGLCDLSSWDSTCKVTWWWEFTWGMSQCLLPDGKYLEHENFQEFTVHSEHLWTIFVRGAMIHAMAQLHWINSDCTAQISLLDLFLQGFAECGHVGTCLIDRNDQKDRISESTFIGKHENPLPRKNPRNQGEFRRNQVYIIYIYIHTMPLWSCQFPGSSHHDRFRPLWWCILLEVHRWLKVTTRRNWASSNNGIGKANTWETHVFFITPSMVYLPTFAWCIF